MDNIERLDNVLMWVKIELEDAREERAAVNEQVAERAILHKTYPIDAFAETERHIVDVTRKEKKQELWNEQQRLASEIRSLEGTVARFERRVEYKKAVKAGPWC